MMTTPVPLKDLLDAIPDTTHSVRPENDGINSWGYPFVMLIFRSVEERKHYHDTFAQKWIEMPDRSAHLNYVLDWDDAIGFGLMMTTERYPEDGC